MLLKKLTEASGISGNEKEVRDIIIKEIEDHVDSLKIDRLGNIIAFKEGKDPNKKIMITAHMDEVGLMVKEIDDMGLLKFITVGDIDKRVLVSKTVLVGDNKIPGVIGAKPIHLQKREEWKNSLNISELYIDIGAKDQKEAELSVEIGDYVTFDSDYIEFGENLVKAKALDNRVGCNLLIDLIKADNDVSFYGVFTVMEEVGLVGAGPAAFEVNPDISLILEGTLCYDMPKLESHLVPTYLNQGPAISLIDRTTVYDKKLREFIVALAESNDIAYQYRKTAMGGNDSGKIHLAKEGSLTATISVPCRNIHSPISVMSKADYKSTFKLLEVVLAELEKEDINEYRF